MFYTGPKGFYCPSHSPLSPQTTSTAQDKKKAYLNHHSHEFGQKATKKTIIPGSEISIKNNKTSSKSDAANKPIEKVSTKKKYLKDNIFHQCLAHYKYSCKGIILVFK